MEGDRETGVSLCENLPIFLGMTADNSHKAYMIERLSQVPYDIHAWHIFPNERYVKALWAIEILSNLAISFIRDDVQGVDLVDVLQQEPQREDFETEDEYRATYTYYLKLKNLLTLAGKIKGKVNEDELIHIIEFINSFYVPIYGANSIKGKRILNLLTESKRIEAPVKSKGLLRMFDND